ncbi:Tuberculostearic acid methyltransferase UfaA1, partial [Ananas comosus]
ILIANRDLRSTSNSAIIKRATIFSLFLDEMTTYSCAIFKVQYYRERGLKVAQLRKLHLLLEKFSSVPDKRYDEYRRSSDFIKEYIFPGACVPSLSRITSAMATASRLCVEHLENIGIHYYQTLQCWRSNFTANKQKILSLGFDEKFVRMWEYYLIYCAAGFKSRTVTDYQMVFSRPGNLKFFNDPFASYPSA